MSFNKAWEETKKLVQSGSVTKKYVSCVLSIDEDMAECLMKDWEQLLLYEANDELRRENIERLVK